MKPAELDQFTHQVQQQVYPKLKSWKKQLHLRKEQLENTIKKMKNSLQSILDR